MDWVFQWISQYGYGAIFAMLVLGIVGLPIPDETIMVFCGYLISRGNLSWPPALACAIAGSWCGITLSYMIGRTAGLGVVHRWGRYFHLNEERLALVNAWFARIGHWALFIGYYIAGVRHFTAIVAGEAAIIAAGLDGIDRELPPVPPVQGSAYDAAGQRMPTTLREAVDLLDGSAFARAAFGDRVDDTWPVTSV